MNLLLKCLFPVIQNLGEKMKGLVNNKQTIKKTLPLMGWSRGPKSSVTAAVALYLSACCELQTDYSQGSQTINWREIPFKRLINFRLCFSESPNYPQQFFKLMDKYKQKYGAKQIQLSPRPRLIHPPVLFSPFHHYNTGWNLPTLKARRGHPSRRRQAKPSQWEF